MSGLLNMLQVNMDVLVIYGLIFVMATLLVIIFIVDFKSKNKSYSTNGESIVIEGETPLEKYETYDDIKNSFDKVPTLDNTISTIGVANEETKPETVKEELELIEVIEPNTEQNNIKYVMKDEEEIKQEAKEELKELARELEEDKNDNIELTDFEVEQEENAIISYNELKKVSDELHDSNEITQYKDEGNEPISLSQLREKFSEVNNDNINVSVTTEAEKSDLIETLETLDVYKSNEEIKTEEKTVVKLDDFAVKTDDNKFKISPVISPVYGIEKEEDKTSIVEDFNAKAKLKLEQTANLEKLDEELRKTNEFLKILKDLQKKLD